MIAVTDALTLLEIFLINRNYVACDHLTIADLSILASVTLLEIAVEFDLTSYPNIWNWYNRLRNELPYYDPLTKVAHDELRALIRNIRDAHEEWSSPVHQCAFVPNGSHADCIEEQRRQYQRLFLNANEQKDAARIMAAVSPVFRKSYGQSKTTQAGSIFNGSNSSSIGEQITSENELKRLTRKTFPTEASGPASGQSGSLKRIRLTIEPNTGQQCLQLAHLDSPQVDSWSSSGESPLAPLLYSNYSDGPGLQEDTKTMNNCDKQLLAGDNFSENYHLCNETFCPNC